VKFFPVAILLLFLAGCSSAPVPVPHKPRPPVAKPKPVKKVQEAGAIAVNIKPVSLPSGGYLASQFLRYYATQPQLQNGTAGQLDRHYRFVEQRYSPDRRRMMLVFREKQGKRFGYISWSLKPRSAIAGIDVLLDQNATLPTLLLSPALLCFGVNAASAPVWSGGRWKFDAKQPGKIFCNGLKNRTAFRAGTRLPGQLHPYFKDGDMALVFDSDAERDKVAGMVMSWFSNVRYVKPY